MEGIGSYASIYIKGGVGEGGPEDAMRIDEGTSEAVAANSGATAASTKPWTSG